MKRFIILIMLAFAIPCVAADSDFTDSIDISRVWLNGFAWTGHVPKDKAYKWGQEVENKLAGDTALDNLLFSERTSDPTSTEGRFYYNTTTNAPKWYNGSSWVTVGNSSGGDSLDTAYNNGNTIDVDGSAVTLTTSDTDNTVVLAIVQNEATNDDNAMTITFGAGAIGTGIVINSQSSGTDISGDNWSIDQAGKLTILEIAATGDALFNGTTYDIAFDASREGFVAEDNSIIGFGAGTHDDAPDLTISGTGTNVNVEVATEDAADLIFGATNALDIIIYNDAADSTVTYDNSAELLTLNGWDIRLEDGDFLKFGDTDDWTATSATAKKLLWTPATGDGSDSFDIGANTAGGDLQLFGADTSGAYALWDSSNDALWLDKADIAFSETDGLLFGDTLGTGDWRIDSTSAVLLFAQVAADTGTVAWGVDGTGFDSKWFGEDASAYMQYIGNTASRLDIVGIDSTGTLFTITGVDATGDSDTMTIAHGGAGDALQITLGDTDSAGIHVLAKAAQTTSSVKIAGGTGAADWDGADNIGMLHLTHDSAMADAGATQLMVLQETATKSDAEGFLARFVSTATAQTGSHAVEIETTNTNPALKLNNKLTITGADSAGILVAITGVNTTGDTDTIVISHDGDGDAIQLTTAAPAGVGLRIIGDAAQTASAVIIDGATGAWLGAANTGMVHLTNDGTPADTAATLLRIAQSGTNISGQEGICLDLVDTSTSGGGTEYAMHIDSTNNEAIYVDSGKVVIDEFLTATGGVQVGVGETMTTAAAEGATQQIDDGVTFANVTSTTGVNEFITLPNDPPVGTVVFVMNNVGANFEIRTLAAGNDSINNIDTSDGATEYLCTSGGANNGDLVQFTYVTADRWIGVSYTYLGAVRTAVVPD